MNKEYYRILKELANLSDKLPALQAKIADELSRLDKIEKMREKRKNEIKVERQNKEESEKFIEQTQQQVEKLDVRIENYKAHLKNTIDNSEMLSLQKQLEADLKLKNELDESCFSKLESLEESEQTILEAENFLKGSSETILEIEEEINEKNAETYKELKIINDRYKNSLEQLPENIQKKFKSLKEKKPNISPITQISSSNTCLRCGYLIQHALVRSVEAHLKFHTCPGCQRILIPESTKFL